MRLLLQTSATVHRIIAFIQNRNQKLRVVALSIALVFTPVLMVEADTSGTIDLEINKVEQRETGCLFYLVTKNGVNTAFDSFKMDMVLFDVESLIIRRIAVNLAPLAKGKTSVKLFELSEVQCEDVGSVLVNEVLECSAEPEWFAPCVDSLALSSRNQIQLYK